MKINEKFIQSYSHHDGTAGALVEIGLESAVPIQSSIFRAFCNDLAMQVTSMDPTDRKELLAQDWIRDPSISVQDAIGQLESELDERVRVMRFQRWDTKPAPPVEGDPPPRKDPAMALRLVK